MDYGVCVCVGVMHVCIYIQCRCIANSLCDVH